MRYHSLAAIRLKTILLAAVIFLTLYPAGIWGAGSVEFGVVVANKLNLRAGPGLRYTPLTVLKKGTRIKILQYGKGWLKITHAGQVGYIRNRSSLVRIIVDTDAQAQITGTSRDAETFKRERENIARRIEAHKAEVKTFTNRETDIIASLNSIEKALDQARKRSLALKSDLAALENKISRTEKITRQLTQQIKNNKGYASRRLVALYKLNWLGKIHVLATAASMHDMIQRKTNLERILSYDESVLENMLQNENALKENLKKLNAQRLEKQTLAIELKNQIGIVSEEKIKRSTLLNEIHNQKSLQLAAIESLKKTANALDRTINSLKRGSNLTQPADTLSTKRFISLKGLLNMPVKGRIVSSFGPYNDAKFKVTNFRSGIDIKAERGEPVYAVCVGSVLFSSWFKGYGNMIILDHGDNYYTVYANVEETFKKKGDRVETGEVIATVGDTGSMIGPKLYFEVRHHGKPIDPKQWIKTG